MNSAIKILLIIGAILFAFGVVLTGVGFTAGGLKSIAITDGGPVAIDPGDENQMDSIDETYQNVSALNMDLRSIAEVHISEGDAFIVKGSAPKILGGLKTRFGPDGTLTVTNKIENFAGWLGASFPFLNLPRFDRIPDSYLDITIPPSVTLAAITLNLDLGNINIEHIASANFTVDADLGNIRMDDISTGSTKIDSDLGKVAVLNMSAQRLYIDSNSGDISIDNSKVSDRLEADSDFGEVLLENVSAGKSVFKMNSGNFTADNFISGEIDLESDFGNIDFSGDINGNANIDSDSGGINLSLSSERSEYACRIEADSGIITLDGNKISGGEYEYDTDAARRTLNIKCDFGNINVLFGH
jgi:hypothetical protein